MKAARRIKIKIKARKNFPRRPAEWTEADYRADIAHVTLDAFGKPTNFKLMTQVRPHPHPGNSSKQQFQA
ncbi:MAG: hypothetical protein IPM93_15815 [Candidatus Obscuribacter sp.]|nr:hypothetical protein [Candidatus Obscuribacter sp.]